MTPAAGAVTLRPVLVEDEEFLRDLFAGTRSRELAALGDERARTSFLDLQRAAQTRHVGANHPGAVDAVVLLDGERVGRLWLDERERVLWIVDIAIVAARRGAGLGTRVLTDLQARASAGGRTIELYAETGGRAHALYLRLGFRAHGEQGLHTALKWTGEEDVRPETAM